MHSSLNPLSFFDNQGWCTHELIHNVLTKSAYIAGLGQQKSCHHVFEQPTFLPRLHLRLQVDFAPPYNKLGNNLPYSTSSEKRMQMFSTTSSLSFMLLEKQKTKQTFLQALKERKREMGGGGWANSVCFHL